MNKLMISAGLILAMLVLIIGNFMSVTSISEGTRLVLDAEPGTVIGQELSPQANGISIFIQMQSNTSSSAFIIIQDNNSNTIIQEVIESSQQKRFNITKNSGERYYLYIFVVGGESTIKVEIWNTVKEPVINTGYSSLFYPAILIAGILLGLGLKNSSQLSQTKDVKKFPDQEKPEKEENYGAETSP